MSRMNSHRRKTKRSETNRSEPGRPRTKRRRTAVAVAVVMTVGAVGIPTAAWAGGIGLGSWSSVASSWWGGQESDTAPPTPSRIPSASETDPSASASPTPARKKRPSRSASPSESPPNSGSPTAKPTPDSTDAPDKTTPPPSAQKATKATSADSTPRASDDRADSGPTDRVLVLVNAERDKAGCSPVTVDAKLTKAAQDHSQDMADHTNMSHTGSDGSSMSDRLARVGYRFSTAGENVAAGYGTPESVMDGWMNSPGHKANILNCAFKEIGIGLAGPGNYWTQNFGSQA